MKIKFYYLLKYNYSLTNFALKLSSVFHVAGLPTNVSNYIYQWFLFVYSEKETNSFRYKRTTFSGDRGCETSFLAFRFLLLFVFCEF
jgi:hypothetical protein